MSYDLNYDPSRIRKLFWTFALFCGFITALLIDDRFDAILAFLVVGGLTELVCYCDRRDFKRFVEYRKKYYPGSDG